MAQNDILEILSNVFKLELSNELQCKDNEIILQLKNGTNLNIKVCKK